MNCCCDKKEQCITIVKGNDTNANGKHLLSIYLTDPLIDLSQATATFTLCGIKQTFEDLSEGVIHIDYSNQQTGQMPLGINYGTLNIIENGSIISTIDNMIAFNVVKNVHGDALGTQPYHYTFEVKQAGETILNVLVEAGVSVEVGTTTTLPAGSDATVENVGTPNHLVLNFGIPQGEKGEKGEDGEQGEKGEDGAEGPQGPAGKDGVDGKDAKINGVNTLTLNATNGIQLNQSGDTASIDGKPLQDSISEINSKIPSSASSSNKLTDVDYVNSSINNMAAFYITSDVAGDPFATRADLIAGPYYFRGQLRQPTQNDYALVTEDETHDDMTSRFMYDGTQWVWQYTLNNTQFTQAQIEAINSGITESLVNKIGQNESSITNLQNTKQDTINDLATIRSGASAGATAVQPAALDNYVPTSRTINGQPLSSDVTIDTLPSQTGQNGKYLTTDGTNPSWGTINALQNQANNASSLDILPLSGSPTITGNNNVLLHSKASSASNYNMVGINVAFGTIGVGAVGIGANNASGFNSVAIGPGAQTSVAYQVAIGSYAQAYGQADIAIGYHAQIKSNLSNCIQLGYGNADQDSSFSFYVGFNSYGNYKLLDGTTGLIPAARHAALPTADGTYTLKLTISDGTPTLSWVAD